MGHVKILSRGGKRKGSGRKPSEFLEFTKKFRASDEERKEFFLLLTGDARKDFILILSILKKLRD